MLNAEYMLPILGGVPSDGGGWGDLARFARLT